MSAAPATDGRMVVVHGPTPLDLEVTLRTAGLTPVARSDDVTVWAPPTPVVPAPAAEITPSPAPPAARLLLTVTEAAHLLGVGRSTAYELIAAGRLEVIHLGRSARVPRAAVERLVEQLRQERGRRSA